MNAAIERRLVNAEAAAFEPAKREYLRRVNLWSDAYMHLHLARLGALEDPGPDFQMLEQKLSAQWTAELKARQSAMSEEDSATDSAIETAKRELPQLDRDWVLVHWMWDYYAHTQHAFGLPGADAKVVNEARRITGCQELTTETGHLIILERTDASMDILRERAAEVLGVPVEELDLREARYSERYPSSVGERVPAPKRPKSLRQVIDRNPRRR